jgi:hypothetical protein
VFAGCRSPLASESWHPKWSVDVFHGRPGGHQRADHGTTDREQSRQSDQPNDDVGCVAAVARTINHEYEAASDRITNYDSG